MTTKADVLVENHGTIFVFQPLTAQGREWLESHTDGMWYGGGLCVEHRYARPLADELTEDGLEVR